MASADAVPAVVSTEELVVLRAIMLTFVCRRFAQLHHVLTSQSQLILAELAGADRTNIRTCWKAAVDVILASEPAQLLRGDRVTAALTYVRDHANEGATLLGRAAAEAGLSRWHLERLLKQQTGRCFRQHLRTFRISSATTLLLDPKLGLKQVAASCGYASASSLCRDFRRELATSPRQWRIRASLQSGAR